MQKAQKRLRKHLSKKKNNLKNRIEKNHRIEPLTEYCSSDSSNCNENEDEKLEYEEKEPLNIIYENNFDDDYNHNSMLNSNPCSYDFPSHPMDNASCCNRLWNTMSSYWVFSLIQIGRQRPIKMNDLYALPKSESLSNTLSKWRQYVGEKFHFSDNQISVLRIIWQIEKSDIIFVFMLNLIRAFIVVGLLYLWQFLIAFYTDPDVPISSGILLAIYMFILNLCRSMVNSVITNVCSSMGTRMMGMIMSVMYDKGLSMDLESSKQQASLNIIGTNLEYVGLGLLYLPSSMVFAIILIIVSFLFLYFVVGTASIIGICFVLFIGIPCQIFVLLQISNADDARFETSDERVCFMNDLFHGIKFTKLYSWEIPFMQRVAQYRNKEKKSVDAYNSNLAWLRLVNFAIPTIMLVLIVMVYVYNGNTLHLFIMFQLIIVAQILSGAIEMIPVNSLYGTEFLVALERIDEFLSIPQRSQTLSDSEENIQRYIKENIAIKIKKANFEWHGQGQGHGNNENNANVYKLKDISMEIKRGKLIAIIGKVGSGKSSLLQSILGEMKMLNGTHYINGTNNGNKDNVIAYVPQTTFILHGTVRDNILLGLEYDEEKYKNVIKMSALEQDFQILPKHDQTEIGEQGVTISGGQKMRISFARALYRCNDSDIFLFDDPLSSVDIDVGQIMFKRGICNLLKDKTRIVVMNSHLFYLRYFDEIYVVNKEDATNESTIAVKVSYDELVTNKYSKFQHLIPSKIDYTEEEEVADDDDDYHDEYDEYDDEIKENEDEGIHFTKPFDVSRLSLSDKLSIAQQNEFETGPVPLSVYFDFFWSAIRDFDYASTWFKDEKYHKQIKNENANDRIKIVYMFFTLFILIISQTLDPCADLILVLWGSNEEDKKSTHYSSSWWISIWSLVIAIISILRLISGLTISQWISRAAFHLNMKTLYFTLRAPMIYYETTPKSAILNRFTKDTNIIDIDIPFDFDIFCSQILMTLSYVMIVCIFIPQMIVIFILVSPLFVYLIRGYRATYIELVRLCIFSLDPITSIFGETLIGLSSIRSYKLQKYFKKLITHRIECFVNLWYVRNSVYSWFDCYLDILIDFIVICATMLGFYARDTFTSPELVAFAIVYLNIISGHLQVAILQLVWIESEFGAVQRLLWYHPSQNNIMYEANPINPDYAKDAVFNHGNVQIKNLKLRYRKKFNLVLDLAQISIIGGEKIGICGRTGAGKSSLMTALFRLVEPEQCSSINIDNIECTKCGLYTLRSQLTIIPQDPILFIGTLRFNLDPFDEFCDETIWDVLKKCKLEKTIKQREGSLRCNVFENGANFSQGQKQLICIARALLKKTKILLLDEATSAIDKHTDHLIQDLIRTHFQNTTVLCIAHRLETIMDYDRILVLKQGRIAEFDKPQKLMKNRNGLFYQMIDTVKSHH